MDVEGPAAVCARAGAAKSRANATNSHFMRCSRGALSASYNAVKGTKVPLGLYRASVNARLGRNIFHVLGEGVAVHRTVIDPCLAGLGIEPNEGVLHSV